ncbi:MAG: alpha/beta fold hydrolase [Candidatus Thorarchaeota archaeon]
MIDEYTEVRGIKLHYHEYPAEGDTIILLHFGFSSLAMWNGIVPYLKDRYRLILLDYRGHGLSDKPKADYNLDIMGDDIVLFMQKKNIEKAHFVGSSLGAELSVNIAARYPDKVLSVVVEGSAMNNVYDPYGLNNPTDEEKEKEEKQTLERIRSSQVFYNSPEELLEKLKERYEPRGFWNQYVQTMAEYEIYETPDGKYTGTVPLWVSESYMKNYWDIRFEDYYKNIKAPVLFLPGEENWKNKKFREALKFFQSFLSDSKIVHIKGGMHAYVWLFYPEECSKAVLEFIEGVKS